MLDNARTVFGLAPARKAGVGTTYTAKGLESADTPDLDVEGGSSQPPAVREIVPELGTSFQRLATYARMKNDAAVDVSMRAAKTPILGAEFFMEPYSDDETDLEISEFIWANLAEGMSAPFLSSMQDILAMFEDGFSVVEKVWEEREWAAHRKGANTRRYIMLRKLGIRPASTIKEIVYDDNGGPISVTQTIIKDGKATDIEIPIEKCIIFTNNRSGGDLMGKSLLRTAYSHWYYKTHLYKIDSIQKERHAIGVPRGTLLPGYTQTDRTILRTLLRNLRTNEESFVVQTPNVVIDFIKLEGSMVDVMESANHHNTMILLNVLGQFISLGSTTEGGGRASAGSQSDLFMKSLKYVANYIADQINMYIIPELVVWNYPTKNFPRLAVRNLGETRDLQQLASALGNLFAQEILTADIDTEQHVRKMFDMPRKLEDRPVAETGQFAPVVGSSTTTANGNGNGNGNTGKNGNNGNKGKSKPSGGFQGKPTGAAE
jgi:hypothetical protein